VTDQIRANNMGRILWADIVDSESEPVSTEADASVKERVSSAASTSEDELHIEDNTIALFQGSALHASGSCKPCIFFKKTVGCRMGFQCAFCHLPHTGCRKMRPSKQRRQRIKRRAQSDALDATIP